MILENLLYGINVLKTIGDIDIDILDIHFDSRKINTGSLFVAIKGTASDGHVHIEEAILSGAKVIVLEDVPYSLDTSVTSVSYTHLTLPTILLV